MPTSQGNEESIFEIGWRENFNQCMLFKIFHTKSFVVCHYCHQQIFDPNIYRSYSWREILWNFNLPKEKLLTYSLWNCVSTMKNLKFERFSALHGYWRQLVYQYSFWSQTYDEVLCKDLTWETFESAF